MRAATALAPLLSGEATRIWRADDLSQSNPAGVVSSGSAELDAELPGGGWPQGALTELLVDLPGSGELSLLAPALARIAAAGLPCVWTLPCEQPARGPVALADAPVPYAPALSAAGIDLNRSIFVQPATPREGLWALEQSLRMPHLGALIGWLPVGHGEADFRALRRLHLLAGHHLALVFVLRASFAASAPSPAALRLHLSCHDGRLSATLLKRRGRPLLEPVTLQIHPERWNQAHVEAASSAASAQVHRAPARPPALPTRRWSMQAIFNH